MKTANPAVTAEFEKARTSYRFKTIEILGLSSTSNVAIYGNFFSQMNTYRRERQFCDVTLKVDGLSFPCHRVVLASGSKFFDSHFNALSVEENEKNDVNLNLELEKAGLQPVDQKSFENVLEYIYCKGTDINSTNAFDLFVSSNSLGISNLSERCEKFLEMHVPEERVFELSDFAQKWGKKQLYEKTVKYIAMNMPKFHSMNSMLTIAHPIFKDVIMDQYLQCPTDDLVDLLVRRQKSKLSNRSEIEKMLTHVKSRGFFGMISSVYLTRLLYEDGTHLRFRIANRRSPYRISEIVYDGNDLKWSCNDKYSSSGKYQKNIVMNDHLFTLSASRNEDNDRDITVNDFQLKGDDDEYQTLARPPVIVTNYALASVYNTVYLYSKDRFTEGNNYMKFMEKVKLTVKSNHLIAYIYDIDEWFSIPKPECDVSNACTVSLNNLLFLINGRCEENCGSHLQFYDPRSPKWIMVEQKCSDKVHVDEVACPFNGEIFILGDDDKQCRFRSFNPLNHKWRSLKCPKRIRSPDSLVDYQNIFWAVANGEQEPIVECYDPITNTWTDPINRHESINRDTIIADAFVF